MHYSAPVIIIICLLFMFHTSIHLRAAKIQLNNKKMPVPSTILKLTDNNQLY